nr:MAG TPA: hypothetical protein [Caudoviricetes sp.]
MLLFFQRLQIKPLKYYTVYAILELQKEQPPPTRGWPILKIEIHPRTVQSLQGWFFYACFQDFIEKTLLTINENKGK